MNVKQKLQITGVKPSISNNQLLISTGIPTLDIILGGGLPIGTIMMIEEDEGGCYSGHMTKYFIAEGVISKHQIFIANLNAHIVDLINTLPSLVNYEKYVEEKLNEELMIAWRYANTPKLDKPISHFSHYYDQNIKMTSDQIASTKFHKYPHENQIIEVSNCLDDLLGKIKLCLTSENFKISENHRPINVLRIALCNFGSPQWWDSNSINFGQKLLLFFMILKSYVRASYSSVIFTFPSSLYPSYIVSRIHSIVDFVVKLESFESTKNPNQIYKDYQGLFYVIKLPHLNSLVSTNESDLSNLAFKHRRKRFTIEKLHLPPLFSEESKFEASSSGCSSTISNNLDF